MRSRPRKMSTFPTYNVGSVCASTCRCRLTAMCSHPSAERPLVRYVGTDSALAVRCTDIKPAVRCTDIKPAMRCTDIKPAVQFTSTYSSPERSNSADQRKVDVWAAGCILYELCVGMPFIRARSGLPMYALMAQLYDPAWTPPQLPRCMSCWQELLNAMLCRDADRRPLPAELLLSDVLACAPRLRFCCRAAAHSAPRLPHRCPEGVCSSEACWCHIRMLFVWATSWCCIALVLIVQWFGAHIAPCFLLQCRGPRRLL
jgi:Protein kinase domain